MGDRSVVGWETVPNYETNPIASDSDDRKKIRQAKNSALTRRKIKHFNKSMVRVPSQRQSGQQLCIDDEQNGFTPPKSTIFQLQISNK